MSYCVNPNCANPYNEPLASNCASCGSVLKLRNRYRANRPLGNGGFGATFLAADEGLPRFPSCVIKQLRPNTQSPSVMKMARELFEREAYTLGKIGSHPQIPRLLDYFEEDGNFYLVQEFVDGETLKQEFDRRGRFSEIEIRKILVEIFPALGFIHQNGVIHRDVKPANIMRRKQDGQLVLIDFGAVSSQLNKPSADDDPSGLLTNFAIGTPGFAPPEQMAMRPVYSSDLYATAMSCLFLMTGESPKDLPHDPYTGEINWKRSVNLSDRMRVIFEKLLQQSVSQRFRSAEEALKALESGGISEETPKAIAVPKVNGQVTSKPSSVTIKTANTQTQDSHIQIPTYDSTQGWDTGMLSTGNTRTSATNRLGAELKGGRKVIVEYSQGKRNFANQNYPKAAFGSANLAGIVMSRSKLVEADFCHSNLAGASFQGANLSQAKLNSANLREAKMQRAILVKSDLGRASMIFADLSEANLQLAYMSKADLSGANLSGANLKGAYLSQANLKGTNLCDADLKGAKISDEQLAQAKTNWGTIRPDGSKRLF
ncbi:MAG: protein kinase domain-containing protein, partial [Pseudanabaena sp.]